MNRTMLIACTVTGTLLLGQLPSYAQGKAHGLNRGLSAASKGMSGSAMSRSSGAVSRASGGPLRSGASVGRASTGLERANAAAGTSIEMPAEEAGSNQALTNQQSILDHRLGQADHLRSVSERNGNQHLLDTADRMEANANRNFQRQQTRLGNATGGAADGADGGTAAPPTTGPTEAASGTVSPTSAPAVTSQPRRGLWLRSR